MKPERAAALVIIALILLVTCGLPPPPTPKPISKPTPRPTPTATPTDEQLAARLRSRCNELPTARADFLAAQREYDDMADSVLAYADRIVDDGFITAREGEQNRANGERLRELGDQLADAKFRYDNVAYLIWTAEKDLGSTCAQRPWLRFAPTPTPAPAATPRPTSTPRPPTPTPTPGPTATPTATPNPLYKANRAYKRCQSHLNAPIANVGIGAANAWKDCYNDSYLKDPPKPVTLQWCTELDEDLAWGRSVAMGSESFTFLEQEQQSRLIPNCEVFDEWAAPPPPTPTPSGPMLSEADCQKVVDDYMGSLVEDVIADYPVALWGDRWQEQSFRYWTEGVYGDRTLLGFNLQ